MTTGDPVSRVAGDRPTLRTLVIIPTFNEQENLPLILQRLHAAVPRSTCWSSTTTARTAPDSWPTSWPRRIPTGCTSCTAPSRTAWARPTWPDSPGASAGSTPSLVEMDADGSHAPDNCTGCWTRVDAGADLAIGSRYVEGGNVQNWPWRRWALSWTANTYARLALGIGIHDITAGYRAYRREVLQKIDLDHVDSKGYCFQIDLTWRTITNGFVVAEVPITFTERELGVSKMSGSNIREARGQSRAVGYRRTPAPQACHAGQPVS